MKCQPRLRQAQFLSQSYRLGQNCHPNCSLLLSQICATLYHAQWLTLACQILKPYVSEVKPSKNLAIIAAFCKSVYFPSWFEIKLHNSISEGSRNYDAVLDRVMKFTDRAARSTALKTSERNSYFAHPENGLLSMLSDEDNQVRCMAINKILAI